MNMLALVDEEKFTLTEQIEVLPRDVWAGVSEIEKRWPGQRRFRLDKMINLMVSKSDNTAVETLVPHRRWKCGNEGSVPQMEN
jgi:beta-lactamase class A